MNLIIGLILIVGIPFWLWMLSDAIMKEHKKRHHANLWVFFIAITFIFGALAYFLVKKKKLF